MKADTRFSLADQLFNAGSVDQLVNRIRETQPDFPGERFRVSVVEAFPTLKLKERITHIADELNNHLALPFPEALAVLLRALPPELDPSLTDNDFGEFITASFSAFVAKYGIGREHLELSLPAIREITKRFSAEYAIRDFLNSYPEETLKFLRECARDGNYHVRRLTSEGTRPSLPWGIGLHIDYHAPLELLDLLFVDSTRFVTRSVANHLNDISKVDPELVVEVLQRWRATGGQTEAEMRYITEHALRTLVKQGHAGALALLGFDDAPAIELSDFSTDTPVVRVGEEFRFSLTLQSHREQTLLIDYAVRFTGGGDGRGARKVFKLKRVKARTDEQVTIARLHPMRLMTTRRLHEGEHQVTLLINGAEAGTLGFVLIAGDGTVGS
ncbi:MAG: DNA alkylation repair protein [Gemmatimonadota bacterium]|jgi:3-methyladenine DNA glycosylase AlkC|nr:DNA alkylation repair protein [Gemmatimonadota bacterium]